MNKAPEVVLPPDPLGDETDWYDFYRLVRKNCNRYLRSKGELRDFDKDVGLKQNKKRNFDRNDYKDYLKLDY
jgi:hypothetical protein